MNKSIYENTANEIKNQLVEFEHAKSVFSTEKQQKVLDNLMDKLVKGLKEIDDSIDVTEYDLKIKRSLTDLQRRLNDVLYDAFDEYVYTFKNFKDNAHPSDTAYSHIYTFEDYGVKKYVMEESKDGKFFDITIYSTLSGRMVDTKRVIMFDDDFAHWSIVQ